jgi:antitoxin MazE
MRRDFADTVVSTNRRVFMSTTVRRVSGWGNSLALRLTKPMAKTAGIAEGSLVRVTVKPGRIVIDSETEPTLDQMLAAFDPKKHGSEAMAGGAVGVEAFANDDA